MDFLYFFDMMIGVIVLGLLRKKLFFYLKVVPSVLPSSSSLNTISLLFRYVSIGDIARSGSHPPNVAAIYRNSDKLFAFPVGYDLVNYPSNVKVCVNL